MRDYTISEFDSNLDRVDNLIAVYKLFQEKIKGRKSVKSADTLRAAVVFLHSSLEEVIRNLFLWKLPDAPGNALDNIPLKGASPTHRPQPFLLGNLAPHRGLFVDNVIRESIEAYVDHMNINNTTELCRCIEMIGLSANRYSQYYPKLSEMMVRRHQIVHQMDRNHEFGVGRHRAQSIAVVTVEKWKFNLNGFVKDVIRSLPD